MTISAAKLMYALGLHKRINQGQIIFDNMATPVGLQILGLQILKHPIGNPTLIYELVKLQASQALTATDRLFMKLIKFRVDQKLIRRYHHVLY